MTGSIKQSWRLIKTLRILARHDALSLLGPLCENWPAAKFMIRSLNVLWRQKSDERAGMRLLQAFSELGPSYIKFGQALSVRADLIGEEIANDLSRLQDKMPPFSSETAIKIIEKEMELPLDRVFLDFEKEPVAAASIAQVHFATTLEGDQVAVKLLRPDVEKRFHDDVALFEWLARQLQRHLPASRRIRPVEVVNTIREWIELELDLRMEGAAASELRENFLQEKGFHVPLVYWDYTSQRILTLERIDGYRFDDLEAMKAKNHDSKEILERATRAFFLQVFRDGFFHADVHPGNMMIKDDGTLCPLDFGIMGRIDKSQRLFLAETFIGFLTGDYELVSKAHFRVGFVPPYKSQQQFTQALRAIGAPIMDKSLEEISVAKLLHQLFQTTEKFDMKVQPSLLLLQKTMLMAEGVGRKLAPSVNMWLLERPLIEDWFNQNFNPSQKAKMMAKDTMDSLARLPNTLTKAEAALDRISSFQGANDVDAYHDGTPHSQNFSVRQKPPLPDWLDDGKANDYKPTGLLNSRNLLLVIIALLMFWLYRSGYF